MVILEGDCFDLIKQQPDNSVDLVITSPPYADIVNYGQNVSIKKPSQYVDWLLPLFTEIHRVLKPSGSFILNINDSCENGYRNTFIYELIYRNSKETPLKLYDTYIWHKRNGVPNGSAKRFRNTTEFIFHFCKDKKQLKFYMDRVLQEPAELYRKRKQYAWEIGDQGKTENGVRVVEKNKFGPKKQKTRYIKRITDGIQDHIFVERTLPDKVRPDNVFRFHTAGYARDNTIRHPAPYHKELPAYFINLLTDEGDVVLDPFSGIGTTGIPCNETGRDYIGYELNPKYVEFSIQRLKPINQN